MRNISKQRLGAMGNLNNAIVGLIDKSQLTPLEVIMVLELLTLRMRQLVALSTQTTQKKK